MRRPARSLGQFALPALGAALLALGCGETTVVVVDGSSTVKMIASAAMERFHDVDPTVNVVVSEAGTGGGMKKFAAREIDVCNASRPMTADEAAACEAAGVEFLRFEVAYDGLALVVNPQNDWCDALTVDQLKTIWRRESDGQILQWSDVNPDWPAVEFKLYGPGDDSGTFDYFTEVINGKAKSSRRDYQASESDNALVTGVAGDRGSLCYLGYAYYEANRDKLKLLAVDAGDGPVKPSEETVRDGTYRPLSRPLFIYVRRGSLERDDVRKFVAYYVEHAGELAELVGYFPVSAEAAERNARTLAEALPAEQG